MITITTPELREGDIVHEHGMRVLIDGEPQLSKSHPGDQTFYHRGLVLNPDEVKAAGFVPYGWLFQNSHYDYDKRCWVRETEPRWTVQGNQLAHWHVER